MLSNAISRKKWEEKKFLNTRSAKELTEQKKKNPNKPHIKNYKHNSTQISSFIKTFLTGNVGLQSTSLLCRETKIHSYKGKEILNIQIHSFFLQHIVSQLKTPNNSNPRKRDGVLLLLLNSEKHQKSKQVSIRHKNSLTSGIKFWRKKISSSSEVFIGIKHSAIAQTLGVSPRENYHIGSLIWLFHNHFKPAKIQ